MPHSRRREMSVECRPVVEERKDGIGIKPLRLGVSLRLMSTLCHKLKWVSPGGHTAQVV